MIVEHETHVYCVAVGHSSLVVLDSMARSDNTERVGYVRLTKSDAVNYEEILQCHLLFIIIDSTIGDELHLGLDLATRAKAAGILTLGICCVEEPIVSNTDSRWHSLEQLRGSVDSLAIVANANQPSPGQPGHEIQVCDSMAGECLSIVHSLSYFFTYRSFVGIDFEDIRRAFSGSTYAAIGNGHAVGDGRATTACDNAIRNLVNKGVDLKDVRGVSITIVESSGKLANFSDVMAHVESFISEDCCTAVADYWDKEPSDEVFRVSLLVSGVPRDCAATLAGMSVSL